MLDAVARHPSPEIPVDLRSRLETARLDLLALFRALDRMTLTQEQIPQRLLRQLCHGARYTGHTGPIACGPLPPSSEYSFASSTHPRPVRTLNPP